MTDQDLAGVCVHGGLRRQCEPCDLADRLEQVEAENARLRRRINHLESAMNPQDVADAAARAEED